MTDHLCFLGNWPPCTALTVCFFWRSSGTDIIKSTLETSYLSQSLENQQMRSHLSEPVPTPVEYLEVNISRIHFALLFILAGVGPTSEP